MGETPGQLRLIEEAPRSRREVVQLYVVSALSNLDTATRQLVDRDVALLKRAAMEAADESPDAWAVGIHAPSDWTAPWQNNASEPEAVYELNARKVQEECDGLIVLGHKGGSFGGGQEIEWAAQLGLPIWYYIPSDPADPSSHTSRISRQIKGTPGDLEVSMCAGGEELWEQFIRWVRSRRGALEANLRRRLDRVLVYGPTSVRLAEMWGRLSALQRREAVISSGLDPRRVQDILTRPSALATASVASVQRLTAALSGCGVEDVSLLHGSPSSTTHPQRAALAMAAEESGWSAAFTIELYEKALNEFAKGGVRRLPFSQPADWREFAVRHNA